ncbi:MAG: fatty-acid synthase [Acidobacteria bacterium]|nr:fatty-acid synthase [Acidobacteriota bacterium]
MAAKDIYHEHVKRALEKDGWHITHDPLSVKLLGRTLQIDLGAERILAAEKGEERIAVEVKSFIGTSRVQDLKEALGPYMLYRSALRRTASDRRLFLAVRDDVYESVFEHPEGLLLQVEDEIHLLVFSVEREEIVKWIS